MAVRAPGKANKGKRYIFVATSSVPRFFLVLERDASYANSIPDLPAILITINNECFLSSTSEKNSLLRFPCSFPPRGWQLRFCTGWPLMLVIPLYAAAWISHYPAIIPIFIIHIIIPIFIINTIITIFIINIIIKPSSCQFSIANTYTRRRSSN